ncbi:MAG TPA: VIT domain-containing protein, partial [Kofleriaceae bacterium]|nr:VIT domain-containing protein [Kofleriaceae bacterium]
VTLADGSIAELGDGGSVKELGDRHVRVTGKVFLDVVPGKGTFTVETGQGQLAVLGTRFVVDATQDATTAAVLRGAVAMRSSGHEEILHAGEEGTMTARTPPVRRPAERLSHLVSWVSERRRRDETPPALPARSGVLVARNPTLQEQEFPLPLRALTVDVHLENQIARVALDQTFYNPQDQQLEGVYKFSLPPDAAVARLAMYVDGRLTESAVVERMQARRIYEQVVYQRRDPALLEQMGASKVSLRIFPLPPKQDKRVILAYTQPLARTYDDVTLTVPLPDLETPVEDVAMKVRIVGCGGCELASPSHVIDVEREGADAIVTYHGKDEKLGDSLILRIRQPGAPEATMASTIADAKSYLLLRARPDTGSAPAPADRPHRWVVLDDTSASRGSFERRAQAELIDHLVQEIDEHDQVIVVAFDATHRRFAPWQDALAIDRRALATFLNGDGGLGETDLVEALAGAKRLLDGDAGYVVYVGDGTATGEARTVDQLRDALAGSKATFIGLGVGDGVDLPTLDALADATGGLATHIDLGDDLAWRALDVVAALYTPRLTGLEATVDAGGDPADVAQATAYLKSRQVAAGEDVDVVVQAPVRLDLRGITLRGQLAGQPWSRTYTIAGTARAPGDAGYLPRLWAQRRLEALVTAGDRAFTPCTTTPCPSDDERAIAAYHARKDEMVALGKQYFLLSQHTSLLVLENDAMYRQYGVTKGSGATWAPYQVPDTIAVAPVSAPVSADGVVWRWPLALTPDPAYDGPVARAAGMDLDANKAFESAGFALGGTIGTGRYASLGTIGHGAGPGVPEEQQNGTGNGYGASGVGRGGGGTGAVVATATPVTGVAEPGDGAAPMAASESQPAGPGQAMAVTAALEPDEAKKDADAPAPSSQTVMEAPMDESAHSLTKSAAYGGAADYKGADELGADGDATGFFGRRLEVGERERQVGGLDLRWGGVGMPYAYFSSMDWRLDDVTAWLPGLVRTTYDDLADELDAA